MQKNKNRRYQSRSRLVKIGRVEANNSQRNPFETIIHYSLSDARQAILHHSTPHLVCQESEYLISKFRDKEICERLRLKK